MIIQTLFYYQGRFEKGEVELRLLPGVPQLQVIGQPDTHIRECGLRLKSALKACGLKWPQGHQIVVNLRPGHFRKSSPGIDLPIALAYLAHTGQLPEPVMDALRTHVVYGEVALDGRVCAPFDVGQAIRDCMDMKVLTGEVGASLKHGQWAELMHLQAPEIQHRERFFDWDQYWRAPELVDLELHPAAAELLILSSHMNLNVLLAGPQGSGKSTWARVLYGLSSKPDPYLHQERERILGISEFEDLRWRPLEQPHHSVTPLAMVGGGIPIQPGVITRAHGGILVMDEFLEFHQHVLESLREPLENGVIEVARKGTRKRLPAQFQLIGTTNLCPCGRLYPNRLGGCPMSVRQCKAVSLRLSGPLLDRFDLLAYSHVWMGAGGRVSVREVKERLKRMQAFREQRGVKSEDCPRWVYDLELSFRRKRSLLRVARGLADREECADIQPEHFHQAHALVVDPIEALRDLFA